MFAYRNDAERLMAPLTALALALAILALPNLATAAVVPAAKADGAAASPGASAVAASAPATQPAATSTVATAPSAPAATSTAAAAASAPAATGAAAAAASVPAAKGVAGAVAGPPAAPSVAVPTTSAAAKPTILPVASTQPVAAAATPAPARAAPPPLKKVVAPVQKNREDPVASSALPEEDKDLPNSPDDAGNAAAGGIDEIKAHTVPSGNAKAPAVVKVPGLRQGSAGVPAGQELVNIDFPEPTEIKDIIKAVALWTGKNVILDRNVNGKVQIISPRKVTKEEAYQAFLSALNLLGLTTVETGKVIKIMPVRTAVKGNLKTFLGSSWTMMTDEIITQIVPLKYIDAKEIQSTLSRIVASNSMIAYPPTNTLIISDSGYKVRRILDILELLDVQGQQNQVAIVPIRFSEAKNISEKVTEIFKNSAEAKKGAGSSGYHGYKIMTDERTNSVIIFGPPRTIADVKALVRKFDIQLDDPSRQSAIHVRPLDYADSKKLAATLSALATGKKATPGGMPDFRRPPIGTVPGAAPGMSEPISVASLGDDVKIAPDESSNSLLITGSHAAYQTINSLIRKLDLRRSQVYVEADILDINIGNGFQFGTSVFAGRGGPSDTSIATTWQGQALGPLIAAQAAANAPGASQTNNLQQIQSVAGAFSEDMTVGILSGKQVNIAGLGTFSPGALIKMIKTDTNTRVLSSPNILTSNNEEAQVVAGQKLFFTSKEITPITGAIANKVEKEDVDLTLRIKPNISQSNYVTLAVDLEQNSVIGIDPTSGLPKLSKRKTKQTVTVKNSQTIVISGLVETREFQNFKKIPLLGDIPIIGWLFRNSNIEHSRNNLMIFLTPHIIHGADDLAAVYKQKLEERDQILASIFGSDHIKDDFYAMLPTKEDGQYVPDDIDRVEAARREEMLKVMYEGSGESETSPSQPPSDEKKAAKAIENDRKAEKIDESPTYVPMAGSGDSSDGAAGGGSDGAVDAAPPPPPPPAEPVESGGNDG